MKPDNISSKWQADEKEEQEFSQKPILNKNNIDDLLNTSRSKKIFTKKSPPKKVGIPLRIKKNVSEYSNISKTASTKGEKRGKLDVNGMKFDDQPNGSNSLQIRFSAMQCPAQQELLCGIG